MLLGLFSANRESEAMAERNETRYGRLAHSYRNRLEPHFKILCPLATDCF